MYIDKDSYVISLREASDRNDSVYIWKRFRNPDQEISRWNEIVKINPGKNQRSFLSDPVIPLRKYRHLAN
jgi:hypothetical protein